MFGLRGVLKFLGFSVKAVIWIIICICATFTCYILKGGLEQEPEKKTYYEGEWDRSDFNPPVHDYEK